MHAMVSKSFTGPGACKPARACLALVGLGLLLAACQSQPGPSPGRVPAEPSHPGPLAAARSASLILITGDRVQVMRSPDGDQVVRLEPGPGREHVGFVQSQTRHGQQLELSVVPADAVALLAAGKLDPRLFNVSELILQGFDDKHGPPPLILSYSGSAAQLRGFAPIGARTSLQLASIHAATLVPDAHDPGALWRSLTATGGARRTLAAPVDKVWLDGRMHVLLDQSAAQIGAPQAHALGLSGQGVTVAILDTGVKADHPDLQGRIVETKDFTGTLASGDDVGHGTHVAGIVAGTGAASDGQYTGIAPEASLLMGRVCTPNGCAESTIIAGMEWAAPRARIVSMSLGGLPSDGTDPVSQALDHLSAQYGTLFVVAAGNSGDHPGSVSAPATADAALAVASVTKQDTMSAFSSRGPRAGDQALKPDIAAPGSDIVAARAPGTPAGDHDPVDADYARLSGTSMATPHVAGAAALLLQQHPGWGPTELKAALMSTATPIADASPLDQGDGRVDLVRATSQQVFALVPSVSQFFAWPHQGSAAKTVTYRNDGNGAVTLTLALTSSGAPVPAGLFTLASEQVTVPAHGSADTIVTIDASLADDGLYTGLLTATSGPVQVVVGLAAFNEDEKHELTLQPIPRSASSPETVEVLVVNIDTQESQRVELTGPTVLRLPIGHYDVLAEAIADDLSARTMLVQPGIDLSTDATTILDSRLGEPVQVTIDRPDAVQGSLDPVLAEDYSILGTIIIGDQPKLYLVPSSEITGRPFVFKLRTAFQSPEHASGEPYRYNLDFVQHGRIPGGHFQVHDDQLAVQHGHYFDQGAAVAVLRLDEAHDDAHLESSAMLPSPAAGPMTEYFTASPDVAWRHDLALLAPGPLAPDSPWEIVTNGEQHAYAPGQVTEVSWDLGALGPGFCGKLGGAATQGAQLGVALALFSPGELEHCTDSTGISTPFGSHGVTGTTTLSRAGVVVGTLDQPGMGAFDLPPDSAAYTLHVTASRALPWSIIGTHVDATWSFTAVPGSADVTWLPLLAVRASGDFDPHNVAPAGPFPLTLQVQRQATAEGDVTELTLAVSYDDGTTWQETPVVRTGATGQATLQHPAGEGFVSLRARAADGEGNRVEQTVLRAYRFSASVAGADAGVGSDAGAPAAGEGGGCGCRIGVTTGSIPAAILGLFALVVVVRPRRRA